MNNHQGQARQQSRFPRMVCFLMFYYDTRSQTERMPKYTTNNMTRLDHAEYPPYQVIYEIHTEFHVRMSC